MPEACAHSLFYSVGVEPRAYCIRSKHSLSELSLRSSHLSVPPPPPLLPFSVHGYCTACRCWLPHGFFLCLPSLSLWSCLLSPPDFSFYHVSHLSLLCGQSLTITSYPAILSGGSRLSIGMAPSMEWDGKPSTAEPPTHRSSC